MAVGVDLVQMVFDRQLLSANEDVAIITMHCRGVAAGLPDVLNPMDDTNRANFAGKLDTWFNLIKASVSNTHKVREYRFYSLPDTSTGLLGPPDKVIASALAGTSSSGAMPPQAAMSVTFRTDTRRTWGRFYIPGLDCARLDTKGRFTTSFIDAVVTATHGLTSRSGTGACLTVWSRSQWTHHDPQTIQIDDIPDVIRSRRFSYPIYRGTTPAA